MTKTKLQQMATEDLVALRQKLGIERGKADAKYKEQLLPIVAELDTRFGAESAASSFTVEQLEAALAAKRGDA